MGSKLTQKELDMVTQEMALSSVSMSAIKSMVNNKPMSTYRILIIGEVVRAGYNHYSADPAELAQFVHNTMLEEPHKTNFNNREYQKVMDDIVPLIISHFHLSKFKELEA